MKHTEEEIVVMKEYHNATDSEVKAFVEDILTGRDVINYVTVAFLSSRAAIKIKQLTGKNVAGNRVVQTVSEVKSKKNYIITAYINKKQPPNP